MSPRHAPTALLTTALLLGTFAGCGPRQQEYGDAEVVQETKTKQLRSWLEGVAQSGQLDSGVETLDETLAALEPDDVSDLATLKSEAAELRQAKSAANVRKHARAMLAELPAAEE